jgi:D-inositol-3-phosphate glycosyltransferase
VRRATPRQSRVPVVSDAHTTSVDMQRPKVLYSFPHTLGRPGIATTANHQIAGVARHVDLELWCTSAPHPPTTRTLVETLVLHGHRIPHRVLGVRRAYDYHDRRVASSLRHRAGDVDVVHCWPAGCLRTLEAARASGVRTVREVPSAFTAVAYEEAEREAELVGIVLPRDHSHRYETQRLDRELAEFDAADALLVPAAYVERTFVDRGFDPAKLVRHQYGYDPTRFYADVRRPSDRPFTALFVGHCEPHKGLHYALRAWFGSGAAAQGRFVICGSFLPAYREKLGTLLNHPSIELRGFVPEIGEVMRRADVLVLPSVTEGSALVTYEARGSGCVLAVSDATGAPCTDGVDALVHPARDEALLTDHLQRLVNEPDLLARLRAASLAGAKELTWEAAGRRLIRIYRDEAARSSQLASAVADPARTSSNTDEISRAST